MVVYRKGSGKEFVPPGHEKMRATSLFGKENGFDKGTIHVSVLENGGGMAEEVHEKSDQIFYVLDGSVDAYSEGKKLGTLHTGDAIHVRAGDNHAFKNQTENPCFLYVITVPPH